MNTIKSLLAAAVTMDAMMRSIDGGPRYSGPDPKFCDLPSCKKQYQHRGRYCSKECKLRHDELLKSSPDTPV